MSAIIAYGFICSSDELTKLPDSDDLSVHGSGDRYFVAVKNMTQEAGTSVTRVMAFANYGAPMVEGIKAVNKALADIGDPGRTFGWYIWQGR